jgi:hypothetical protein
VMGASLHRGCSIKTWKQAIAHGSPKWLSHRHFPEAIHPSLPFSCWNALLTVRSYNSRPFPQCYTNPTFKPSDSCLRPAAQCCATTNRQSEQKNLLPKVISSEILSDGTARRPALDGALAPWPPSPDRTASDHHHECSKLARRRCAA